MQKILDLLTKAGCKPELVNAIGESLEQYKTTTETTIKEQYEADYVAKIAQAKKVCIDETNTHKRELTRRLQIFLETKAAAIESHHARQLAIGESEAMTKLREVRALLENVELNGQDNGQAKAVIESAKRKIQQLSEERDQAVAKANRQNAIAEKVLRRNRQLVSENTRLKVGGVRRPMTEGKEVNGSSRIDASRRAQSPTTTRPTIVENQTRRPPPKQTKPNERAEEPVGRGAGFGIDTIAAQMDEDVI